MKHIFKRELAAFLAAAAVLGGILAGATHYLTPQQHDYGSVWGMYEQEQTDSIDVLFFGSSVTYCDVVPAVYWENSGLTAFVQAGPGATASADAGLLKRKACARSHPRRFRGVHRYSVPQIHGLHQDQHRSNAVGHQSSARDLLMPNPKSARDCCFRCTSITTAGQPSKSEDVQPYTEDMLAGYTFLSGGTDKGPDDCETVDIAPEDWERNMDAPLRIFYALCRRNNIQLVLYRAPTKRLHDADWDRLTAQFDGRDGVSTLNCSDYTAQIAADPENDFYDSLHYNCVGAEKFSAFRGLDEE